MIYAGEKGLSSTSFSYEAVLRRMFEICIICVTL